MSLHRRAAVAALSVCSIIAAGLAVGPTAEAAPSADVVINEVYGGGGNAGALFTHDFIEVENRGTTPVNLDGWSVQYATAAGNWSTTITPLSGTLEPGQLYLVREASGGANGTALPAADATGTINLSATSGTVALARGTDRLTCNATSCANDARVVDLLGYGGAAIAETAPASGGSATTSTQRTASADTDNNLADFIVGAPTPKAPNVTGSPGADCSMAPPPEACIAGPTTIQDVQGVGFVSPLRGNDVAKVPGVVTAVRSAGSSRGFWIQQPARDASRPAASSGVFVFTASPTVSVGDAVLVSGKVSEYYPLGTGETVSTTANLSMTEITPTTVTTVSRGNPLPEATVISATTVPDVYAPAAPGGAVEAISPVDPARSALEFWEAHEGMLVTVTDARVVGPGKPQYGEIYVTSKPEQQVTPRGGTYLPGYDAMPSGRVLVMPVTGTVPAANVGDVLTGQTTGPVDWSTFGGYSIAATTVGAHRDNGLVPDAATPQASDQLAVATYNVQNLAPSDPAAKYGALARGVVDNLKSPDVISLEEIQDNSGATDDGTVAADQTLTKLTAAITAAGGPAYEWAQIDPVDGADGGQPGGNIRVAFLYNPTRVTFVARPGGDSTTAVAVTAAPDGTAQLSVSPGRVDPANEAWTTSRKPLAGEFVFGATKVIIVANHFNSKGGDQSADGRFQPPTRSSEVQRVKQATVLNGFVKQVLAADPSANIVLAGDFNDYQFAPSMKTLTDDGATLTDLIETLPANERYTYVYNGVSQVLDHIFVSKALATKPGAVEYDVVHLNSEFSTQSSDHDPQVVRIRPVPQSAMTTLNLLNINDFHGRIDSNTVKFAGTIEQLRAQGGASSSLLLSAGDNIGATLFASASQQDQPTIDVLNALGLSASAVGNHELDQGFSDLTDRVINGRRNASWGYLAANLYRAGTTTPARPEYEIFTVNGTRVAVIGAITQETPTLVSPAAVAGLEFGDPVEAVNRVAARLTDGDEGNGEADVIVAEYHEGSTDGVVEGATLEQEIAAGGPFADIVTKTSPKVAAIFTGHTHKLYSWDAAIPGAPAGKTRPIVQTGSYGENVGHIALTIDRSSKQVVSYTSNNVPRTTTPDAELVAQYPRVRAVKSIVDTAIAEANRIGSQPVGKVTADITTAYLGANRDDRSSESTLGNLVANALRDSLASADRGAAQIGVVNPGGLRAELLYGQDGTITYAQANNVLPFVNNLWTLTLTGDQFKQVLEEQWQPTGQSRTFLNLGLSDNVSYTYDPAAPRGSHVTSITVNGRPIDPTASYRVGTFSFLALGGDNFGTFAKATNVKDTGLVDRDAWIDYLKAHSPVSPSFARRGVVAGALPGEVQAGQVVSVTLGKLDLTSLGSPANATVTATLGGRAVGTFPVTDGGATVSFTIPTGVTGPQNLTLVATPSGTTVTIPLQVTPAPVSSGEIKLSPPKVKPGKSVQVHLDRFVPGELLTITLDGTDVLAKVAADRSGSAKIKVDIAATVKSGMHRVVVRAANGATVSATLEVSG